MISRRPLLLALTCALLSSVGCARWGSNPALPERNTIVLDQLVVYSDTPLPQHHRLLEELRSQRALVSTKLGVPVSDEPIQVYLFRTSDKLDAFMHSRYPELPKRRAFFVESDTRLTVYAYWGDRVAEDLRHEVSHGYLHAAVPHLPLWLDEGLAEYFEVPRGLAGLNRPHVEQLTHAAAEPWNPDLVRLEKMDETAGMTQRQYAESWAWVHFLLETTPERSIILQNYLKSLSGTHPRVTISEQLQRADPQYAQRLIEHLAALRQSLP
jgi:hypothetical protein